MKEKRPRADDEDTHGVAPSVTHADSRDLTQILARVRQLYGAEAEAQIADSVHWQAEILSLGPLTLVQGAIDTPSSISGSVARHIVLMSRANPIAAQTRDGALHTIAAQSAIVASPGQTLTLHNPADMRSLHLAIDPTFLTRQLEALTGQILDESIHFQPSLDLSTGVGAFLQHTCHYLAEEALHHGNAIPSSLAASLSESLSRALLTSHPHNHSHLLEKPAPPSSRTVVRLVEEYVDAHANGPIVATDLARMTGTSVASIDAAFRKHRGMSPMAFLRQRRLERARQALRSDSRLSMTSAAHLAGYLGVDAFEAAYFRAFRETPAETKRRGLTSNGSAPRTSRQETDRERVARLSEREREVCGYVTKGLLNKQIALEMGIAEKTVQEYRGRAMQKLELQSVAELVKVWEEVGD